MNSQNTTRSMRRSTSSAVITPSSARTILPARGGKAWLPNHAVSNANGSPVGRKGSASNAAGASNSAQRATSASQGRAAFSRNRIARAAYSDRNAAATCCAGGSLAYIPTWAWSARPGEARMTQTLASAAHAAPPLDEDGAWNLLQALALSASRGVPALAGGVSVDERG